jgi:hypothetical protein
LVGSPRWNPQLRNVRALDQITKNLKRESYELVAKRIEKVLETKEAFEYGAHGHLAPIEKSPKVRLVNLICPIPFAQIEESRKRYRQYINMLYEASINDAAFDFGSLSLTDTDIALKAVESLTYVLQDYPKGTCWKRMDKDHITNYPYAVNTDWIREAREALPTCEDDKVLYTGEWDREVHARYDAKKALDDDLKVILKKCVTAMGLMMIIDV